MLAGYYLRVEVSPIQLFVIHVLDEIDSMTL